MMRNLFLLSMSVSTVSLFFSKAAADEPLSGGGVSGWSAPSYGDTSGSKTNWVLPPNFAGHVILGEPGHEQDVHVTILPETYDREVSSGGADLSRFDDNSATLSSGTSLLNEKSRLRVTFVGPGPSSGTGHLNLEGVSSSSVDVANILQSPNLDVVSKSGRKGSSVYHIEGKNVGGYKIDAEISSNSVGETNSVGSAIVNSVTGAAAGGAVTSYILEGTATRRTGRKETYRFGATINGNSIGDETRFASDVYSDFPPLNLGLVGFQRLITDIGRLLLHISGDGWVETVDPRTGAKRKSSFTINGQRQYFPATTTTH